MASSASAKRKRVETEPEYEYDETRGPVWFSDGNIVLQAGALQFKVHRDVLSLHSPVFKDMFTLPYTPMENEIIVDGCPIVALQDSARDVEHMLREIYSYRAHEEGDPPDIQCLAAMMRMGKKFQMDRLERIAVRTLTAQFPSTLPEWDLLPVGAASLRGGLCDLVDVLNLAHETGLQIVLPTAFYCANLTVDEVFGGVARRDGSIAVLAVENQRRLLGGRGRLQEQSRGGVWGWVESADKVCATSACQSDRRDTFMEVLRRGINAVDLLEPWADSVWTELCCECKEYGKTTHEGARREFWETLPTLWGLPEWGEL